METDRQTLTLPWLVFNSKLLLPYPLKYPLLGLHHSTWTSRLVFISDWIFGIILYIIVTVAIYIL